ncbi:Beta-1,3-galactosyltransferase 1 [Armadillidium vulgare]|nr:Beta-1,3-galactosyltransferase 1 [Armadillidium vulgare]
MENLRQCLGPLTLFRTRLLRCPLIIRAILTPTALVIFIILFFILLLIEVPHILPIKSDHPHFIWSSHLSRNVSSYIRLDKETALRNPHFKCSSSMKVLFIIPSSVNNTLQRDAIRKTWGSWVRGDVVRFSFLKDYSIYDGFEGNMKLLFILGRDEKWMENRIGAKILKESIRHKDIIVEDFIDSYTNLTLKSLFILKWIDRNCPNVEFVVKADDDMFINVPNLLKVLVDPTLQNPLMLGSLICNAKPVKNPHSKWYAPSYMFSGKYPNYLSGTSYVISGNIAKKLLGAALDTPYFHLEDVFITGICAKKIGVKPMNHKCFTYIKRAFNPCIYKDIITGHEVSGVDMKKLWNMLKNDSIMNKCMNMSSKVLYPYYPGKCVWT